MNAKTQDKIARAFLWFIGFMLIAILAAFLGYMLYKGLPILSPKFIFGMPSDTEAGGGVGPQLFNTIYILFLSMAFSIFIALGAAIYLSEYAKDTTLTRFIRLSTESLATVPSIVLGLFGMIVFVDFLGMGSATVDAVQDQTNAFAALSKASRQPNTARGGTNSTTLS